MTIFYTCSFTGKTKYQKQYDLVLDALEQHPINIISPEKGNYRDVLTNRDLKLYQTDQELHYHAIRKNIQRADAVVIEVSHQDFQIGWEAAYAVDLKKHVLALSIHEDYSFRLQHPYFTGAQYDDYSIDEIVAQFLQRADTEKYTERFNFFLSKKQLDILNQNAQKHGLNQSEYLRSLIEASRS